jgi:hypothetical protein
MDTALDHSTDSWNIGEGDKLEPKCSFCECGHTVSWYVLPPPECPYCNAKMTVEPSDACVSFPWLSW